MLFGATLIIDPPLASWLIVAFISFLIYPTFWDRLREKGKPDFGPIRMGLAGVYTAAALYVSYSMIDVELPWFRSQAEKAVAASLRDPSSAQFRNVVERSTATCGEVNGKNAFGAYVGFKRFVYKDGTVLIDPETPNAPTFEAQATYINELNAFTNASLACLNS